MEIMRELMEGIGLVGGVDEVGLEVKGIFGNEWGVVEMRRKFVREGRLNGRGVFEGVKGGVGGGCEGDIEGVEEVRMRVERIF